jgi:hypothetical protein
MISLLLPLQNRSYELLSRHLCCERTAIFASSGTKSGAKAIHIQLIEADRSSPGVLWLVWKLG